MPIRNRRSEKSQGEAAPAPRASATRSGVRHVEVAADDCGRRLDNYLLTHFKGVPKSRIYRAIRSGQVRVNGGRARPSRRVEVGDVVRVPPLSVAAPALRRVSESEARRFDQAVVFEDEHFIVINKPGGVVVHGGSRHNFGVVEMSRVLRGGRRFPALAHRLDRGTSGCLLLAKSPRALFEAQRVFRLRAAAKTYTALVVGEWDETVSRVCLPLAVTSRAQAKVVVDEAAGKPAVTGFEIAGRFAARPLVCTLLRVTPQTGRMHQIRVHAAACGHPVAGDRRYGDFAVNREFARRGLRRLCLHASRLSLECMGREYDFESPLPGDLAAVLRELQGLVSTPSLLCDSV